MITRWGGIGAAIIIASLSLVLYLPGALHFYFQNDDWVLLGYFGRWRGRDFWRIFLPWESIWMYRPLQVLEYAAFYKLFGLHPFAYNLSLLLMHVVAAVLAYVLLRMLAGGRTALLALAIFCLTWVHGEVLLWKGNVNTLQHACLALAACVCFLRSSRSDARRWLVASAGFMLLDLFAKESAVFTPALMLLCAWYARCDRGAINAGPRRLLMLILPSVILCVVYAAVRAFAFRHLLPEQPTDYVFVGLQRGIFQFLYSYKFALLSFYEDPLLLPRVPGVQAVLGAIWGPLVILPALLLLLAVRLRDRLLLFALAWMPIAFGPSLFLERFNLGRYYYLSDIGAALIWARLLLLATEAVRRIQISSVRRAAYFTGTLALAYLALANIATIRKQVTEQERDSATTRRLFRFVEQHRAEIPPRSVVWIYPPAHTHTGVEWGAREMIQFASGDTTLEGHVEGEPLTMARRAKLDGYGVVSIDMRQEPWRLARDLN
ncbi:MAG: ArnT family glycosyltransferase [Candidatus Sumerlaeaceae bacterium]